MRVELDRRSQREIRDLLSDLRRIPDAVGDDCRDEFRGVSRSVANDARARAPRLSGQLRNSIDDVIVSGDVAVVADVPYAAIQNAGGNHPVFGRGSVRQDPTWFLSLAVEHHEDDFMTAADRAVGTASERHGFH